MTSYLTHEERRALILDHGWGPSALDADLPREDIHWPEFAAGLMIGFLSGFVGASLAVFLWLCFDG